MIIAINGAAIEKTNKCFLILGLSKPSCNRKDTKPNAAGACNKKSQDLPVVFYNDWEVWLPTTVK